MTVSFEDTTEFDMPVVFVEGRGDYHVSSNLAYEYFQTIKSQKQFYWFENSCHFPQWSEPQRFYEVMETIINTEWVAFYYALVSIDAQDSRRKQIAPLKNRKKK